jgi:hypothetical protein
MNKRSRATIEAICLIGLLAAPACARDAQSPANRDEEKAFYAFTALDFASRCSDFTHTQFITDAQVRQSKLKIGYQMLNAGLASPFRLVTIQRAANQHVDALDDSKFTVDSCKGAMATVRQIESMKR